MMILKSLVSLVYISMTQLSFRDFIESEELTGHLAALSSNLGIEPEDIEGQPFVGSFMNFGKNTLNLSAYQIVDFKRDSSGKPTHALVKLANSLGRKRFKKQGEKQLRVDDDPDDDKTYLVPIDKVQDLMTQPFAQQAAGAGAGAEMGMPPGGGPPMM
jgi:hypothetical protein